MAAADPSSLFLAAALAAGLVEGSSVIRYYRRHALRLQQSNVNVNASNNDGSDNSNSNDGAAVPPILAAHSIIYGVASVPLGIVGASPGHFFLPKSLFLTSTSTTIVECDGSATSSAEDATMDDIKHQSSMNESPPADASDMQLIGGTGRGMGRMLRHENAKKMIHNKLQRRHLEVKSTNMNNIKPGALAANMPLHFSSRYIATLDGVPLPTPLAEAMRRSRCIFIGAGLVSYVISQYYLSDRHRNQHDTRNSHQMIDPNFSFGYGDQWMNNSKSITLWNERIKYGKTIDDMELLKQLQNDLIQQGTVGSALHSNDNPLYLKTKEVMVDGIYNATKWINLQLLGRELDEPPFSLIRYWKTVDTKRETINSNRFELSEAEPIIIENNNVDGQAIIEDEGQKSYNIKSDSQQQSPPKQPSTVWKAAVTSVDVLGTSIRHLLISTYRVASAVAGRAKGGQRSCSKDDEVSNDVTSNANVNDNP